MPWVESSALHSCQHSPGAPGASLGAEPRTTTSQPTVPPSPAAAPRATHLGGRRFLTAARRRRLAGARAAQQGEGPARMPASLAQSLPTRELTDPGLSDDGELRHPPAAPCPPPQPPPECRSRLFTPAAPPACPAVCRHQHLCQHRDRALGSRPALAAPPPPRHAGQGGTRPSLPALPSPRRGAHGGHAGHARL